MPIPQTRVKTCPVLTASGGDLDVKSGHVSAGGSGSDRLNLAKPSHPAKPLLPFEVAVLSNTATLCNRLHTSWKPGVLVLASPAVFLHGFFVCDPRGILLPFSLSFNRHQVFVDFRH